MEGESRLERLGTRLGNVLDRVLGPIAAALLFAMMVITFVDVFGRYLFNSPIPGAFEVTEIMMAVLIFAGLPLISAQEGHVSVALLDALLGKAAKRIQRLTVNLVGCGIAATLCLVLWDKAASLADYGDATGYLHIPMAPVAFVMSVLSGLTSFIFLLNAARRDAPGDEGSAT